MHPIDSIDLTTPIRLAQGAVRAAEAADEPPGVFQNLLGRFQSFVTMSAMVQDARSDPDETDLADKYLEGLVSLGKQIDSACITVNS